MSSQVASPRSQNPSDSRSPQRPGTSQSTTPRPLEYHDHNESSSLLARGEQLLAQTAKFEAQAHRDLSDLGLVISATDTSCIQLSDNQAILGRLIYVDDYVQKVETLRRDFAALEAKLPQLDEVIDRLQTISTDTRKEISGLIEDVKNRKPPSKENNRLVGRRIMWMAPVVFGLMIWIVTRGKAA